MALDNYNMRTLTGIFTSFDNYCVPDSDFIRQYGDDEARGTQENIALWIGKWRHPGTHGRMSGNGSGSVDHSQFNENKQLPENC